MRSRGLSSKGMRFAQHFQLGGRDTVLELSDRRLAGGWAWSEDALSIHLFLGRDYEEPLRVFRGRGLHGLEDLKHQLEGEQLAFMHFELAEDRTVRDGDSKIVGTWSTVSRRGWVTFSDESVVSRLSELLAEAPKMNVIVLPRMVTFEESVREDLKDWIEFLLSKEEGEKVAGVSEEKLRSCLYVDVRGKLRLSKAFLKQVSERGDMAHYEVVLKRVESYLRDNPGLRELPRPVVERLYGISSLLAEHEASYEAESWLPGFFTRLSPQLLVQLLRRYLELGGLSLTDVQSYNLVEFDVWKYLMRLCYRRDYDRRRRARLKEERRFGYGTEEVQGSSASQTL